jgi:hypothetical protein
MAGDATRFGRASEELQDASGIHHRTDVTLLAIQNRHSRVRRHSRPWNA